MTSTPTAHDACARNGWTQTFEWWALQARIQPIGFVQLKQSLAFVGVRHKIEKRSQEAE